MRMSDWSSDVCSSDLDDDGNPKEQHRRQFGRQREEVSDAAYASDNVTQSDGNSSAHNLFDDRSVCGEAGGDFRWPVFFKESGCQPEQIGLNRRPYIRNDSFTEPGNEIIARSQIGRAHV